MSQKCEKQVQERAPYKLRHPDYVAIDLENESLNQWTGICPVCGKTLVKNTMAVDSYSCVTCRNVYRADELVKENT